MSRILALLALAVAIAPARAHERSASFSTWMLGPGGARVGARLAALEATRLPPGTDVAGHLADRLRLVAGGVPCRATGAPRPLAGAPGERAWEWEVACAAPGALRIESHVLVDQVPSHLHFARVIEPDGRRREHVFSARERTWTLAGTAGPSLAGAVGLGVEHILSGWDHLAFVLALLLLGGTLGDTVRVVTGFTVAHSVTLALATLGWLRPAQAPVEALIGLSIALVAAENVWLAGGRGPVLPAVLAAALVVLAALAALGLGNVPPIVLLGLALFTACHLARMARAARPLRLRWSAAFAFGLLHGFGFASVLLDAHLPPAVLARVLVGFNAGVELGQLAVVALAFPLVAHAGRWRPALVEYGSAGIAGLGVFWFVARAFAA